MDEFHTVYIVCFRVNILSCYHIKTSHLATTFNIKTISAYTESCQSSRKVNIALLLLYSRYQLTHLTTQYFVLIEIVNCSHLRLACTHTDTQIKTHVHKYTLQVHIYTCIQHTHIPVWTRTCTHQHRHTHTIYTQTPTHRHTDTQTDRDIDAQDIHPKTHQHTHTNPECFLANWNQASFSIHMQV